MILPPHSDSGNVNRPVTKEQLEKSRERPAIPCPRLDLVPEALRGLDRWLSWTWARAPKGDRWAKVPCVNYRESALILRWKLVNAHDSQSHFPFDRVARH